jgi:hypothetical protein
MESCIATEVAATLDRVAAVVRSFIRDTEATALDDWSQAFPLVEAVETMAGWGWDGYTAFIVRSRVLNVELLVSTLSAADAMLRHLHLCAVVGTVSWNLYSSRIHHGSSIWLEAPDWEVASFSMWSPTTNARCQNRVWPGSRRVRRTVKESGPYRSTEPIQTSRIMPVATCAEVADYVDRLVPMR